ncbi:MAG: hypothetical protein FJ206_07425 [Gemmatimonadetes bacterium]|nr:hypothetical protein [Gemmatimonadota bacterium]
MSLIELATALSVVAVLTAGVVRMSAHQRDRLATEQAQGRVVDGYRRATGLARAWGRPAELVVAADSIVLRSVGVSDTAVVVREPGPSLHGVDLTPSIHRVQFAASGLATGPANVTHTLVRGISRRTVVVSRLGRLTAQ